MSSSRARHLVRRYQPCAQAAHPLPPVIACPVHHQKFKPLLDQCDEREERIASRLALEQVIGRCIGGRHHNDAAIEQRVEQPAQNHRIGDIVDLELIEAKQSRFGRDLFRKRRDWIGNVGMRPLVGMKLRMDVLHEAVEMNPPLAGHLCGLEEQVHQHGLAATDIADEVEAGGHVFLGVAPPHQPGQKPEAGLRNGFGIVVAQPLPQILQPIDRHRLRGIGRQRTVGDHRLIGR